MVLIISNELDTTTGDVIDYMLFKYNLNSIRINELSIDTLPRINISIRNEEKTTITLNGEKVKFIWNRKSPKFTIPEFCQPELESFYTKEYTALLSFFDLIGMSHLPGLGSVYFNPYDVNKLHALNLARELDIKIPKTTIVNSKVDFENFLSATKGNCITKPIQSVTTFYKEETDELFKMLTSTVSRDEQTADIFFPSLLQEEVSKQYELRVFYIYGEFYSVAIFSQSNEKTRVDFRHYDSEKPNRLMNHNLPKEIKTKLHQFMKNINLTTGSIDLIYSDKGEYIFLEVNPFGMLGHFTDLNVDINKIIAKKINNIIYEKKESLIVNKMKSFKNIKSNDTVIKIGKSKRHQTNKFRLIPCYKPISLMLRQ